MMRVYRQAECGYCHQFKFIAAHGLCRACYSRERLNGTVEPKPRKGRALCSEMGCSRPVASYGKCDSHRIRYRRKTVPSTTDRARQEREYRKENFDRLKNHELKRNFGITLEKYQELMEKQGGVCAICGQKEKRIHRATGAPMNLAVDHNHTTGKIRGLLCSPCNHGIGNFSESIDLIEKAIDYLNLMR